MTSALAELKVHLSGLHWIIPTICLYLKFFCWSESSFTHFVHPAQSMVASHYPFFRRMAWLRMRERDRCWFGLRAPINSLLVNAPKPTHWMDYIECGFQLLRAPWGSWGCYSADRISPHLVKNLHPTPTPLPPCFGLYPLSAKRRIQVLSQLYEYPDGQGKCTHQPCFYTPSPSQKDLHSSC